MKNLLQHQGLVFCNRSRVFDPTGLVSVVNKIGGKDIQTSVPHIFATNGTSPLGRNTVNGYDFLSCKIRLKLAFGICFYLE